jgi:hypothetical protein
MSQQSRWIPHKRAFAICYALGFLACFLSQAIVSHQDGPAVYSNLLFALVFVFREWLGQFSIIAHSGANLTAQIVSSALVAVFFPAVLFLFRSDKRAVRVSSLILLAILTLMTLWWGRFPQI